MNDHIDLSVIIPAYNEAANFSTTQMDKVYSYLQQHFPHFELLLADDGSTDSTLQLMREFATHKPEVAVLALPHQGKGPTVATAMQSARGSLRLFTDFDQSTPIEEVGKLVDWHGKGYEIVIGSREVVGAKRDNEPWYRHIMGKVFNIVVQIMALRGIHDSQCGFKLFSAEATKALFPRLVITNAPKKDAFTGAADVELLFLARKMGFRVKEVPVYWRHVKSERVAPIKDSIRMFSDVIRIRWAFLRGRYA
jgi:dolichyl-phosphate beta-glucosyltransferase